MGESKKYDVKEVRAMIDQIIDTLDTNFKPSKASEKISYDDILLLITDLNDLFNIYTDLDTKECGRLVINKYIKILNLMINLDTLENRLVKYHGYLENAYKLAARVSLEHFIVYYEWYEDDKLYENRENILKAYVYYLNKMCFDRSFTGIIANLPSRVWQISRVKTL